MNVIENILTTTKTNNINLKNKNMIKLNQFFKKIVNNPPNLGSPESSFKGKSMNEIIDEIHHTFYTEVDRLLESASVSHSLETQYEALLNKRDRLIKLGFQNTKEVVSANKEVERLDAIRTKNNMNEQLKKAIKYFSQKYPLYKFITEESVLRICNKYGLILGDIDKYIGGVPDKNLKQIEEFKIDENDVAYFKYYSDFSYSDHRGLAWIRKKEFLTKNDAEKYEDCNHHVRFFERGNSTPEKCGFEIAANKDHFDMRGMEIQNFQLLSVVQDPVVFMPVIFEKERYFLIVSAWGQESSDPDVVNEINN